jgi:hypothetical protein
MSDNGLISISVLDLPQVHTKPSGTEILRALDILAIKPRSFASNAHGAVKVPAVHPIGVTRYLTSFISSSLSWLDTDELREAVWDAAAARLSERSGRTGIRNLLLADLLSVYRLV